MFTNSTRLIKIPRRSTPGQRKGGHKGSPARGLGFFETVAYKTDTTAAFFSHAAAAHWDLQVNVGAEIQRLYEYRAKVRRATSQRQRHLAAAFCLDNDQTRNETLHQMPVTQLSTASIGFKPMDSDENWSFANALCDSVATCKAKN
ncbi:MAG: hypothetical protein WBP89_16085 [Sedimenticolaceae bacterium]